MCEGDRFWRLEAESGSVGPIKFGLVVFAVPDVTHLVVPEVAHAIAVVDGPGHYLTRGPILRDLDYIN